MQRGFQFLALAEMVRLQHLRDPPVEALNHAIGLRMLRRGQAVFDAGLVAELVEFRPVAARLRRPKRRSVNSFALSVNTVLIRIGQTRSRSRKNRRARPDHREQVRSMGLSINWKIAG